MHMPRKRPLWRFFTVTGALLFTLLSGASTATAATTQAVITSTEAATAGATAWIVQVDDITRTAEIAGTGQPGAVITADAPTGPVTTTVPGSGEWTMSIPELADGLNTIGISHTHDGTTTALTTLYPHIGAFELIPLRAQVDGIDTTTGTVSLSGNSRTGSTITVTTPTGEVFTTVALDQLAWSLEIPGLPAGENTLLIHENFSGVPMETVEISVIIGPLETPVTGGLAVAALLASGIGAALWRRRLRMAPSTT